MSKNLLKVFNYLFPFTDFLYLLQLEEYDNARYFFRIRRFFFRRDLQRRDTLKFTSRIQTTCLLSVGIYLLSCVFIVLTPFWIIVPTVLIPYIILVSNIFLTPFYELMKYRLQLKASKKVKELQDLKIIAIAGSYGKTTTKNFLNELIKFDYKTQMVPGNINTPTGIAAWVLRELQANTEILLVEMDSYFIGEIRRSCMVTAPDISVVTSIGDQHVERFGTRERMAEAILEVFKYAKPNSQKYMLQKEYNKLSKLGIKLNNDIKLIKEPLNIKTNIKSDSAKIDLTMAVILSRDLGVSEKVIKDTSNSLELPDRRQKPVKAYGYDVIDDSYNISATTAREGVLSGKKLAKTTKKKLVVITAGIPEVGANESEVNKDYSKFLSENADNVILLKSVFYQYMRNNKFDVANTFPEALELLEKYPSSKYVLLFQPELTDLYY